MELEKILNAQLSFFQEKELKQELVKHSKVANVEASTPILQEGMYVKSVPLLLSGLVKVVKWESGKEILLYYIYPLESCIVSIHCGMNDLKSKVKAIAEDDSTALILPAQLVGNWQRKYPSFNQFILNLYQKRFENLLDTFNAMAFQSLDKRIFSYLRSKSMALDTRTLKMTHQDLADELGTARESASRMLKKLEVEDKIRLHRGAIEVL